MAGFELTVLGGFGGPLDGDTQSFMLKPKGCQEYGYICVDAGSGLRELVRLMGCSQRKSNQVESYYENEFEPIHKFHDPESRILAGVGTLSTKSSLAFCGGEVQHRSAGAGPVSNAIAKGVSLYHEIGEIFITHSHIDHIAAMVVNSPANCDKGKTVIGLRQTVSALQRHVFNDQLWPNLATGEVPIMKLVAVEPYKPYNSKVIPAWNITAFPVSHGLTVVEKKRFYSTAFFIQDSNDGDALVVCGDVESDKTSGTKYLSRLWKHCASAVPFEKLRGIVVECSTLDLDDESRLYGHMSPMHVIWELKKLKQAYHAPLDGLNVIITHVKMAPMEVDPRIAILQRLREQCSNEGLGSISFSIAIQGYTHQL